MRSGKVQVQEVGGHVAKDQNKPELLVGELTIPDQFTKFYSRDWLIQSIIY